MRFEPETGISLPDVGLGWLVTGLAAATAVMVCAVVEESCVDEFVACVEAVETGVGTAAGAAGACATGALAVVVAVTDEFTVVVTTGAGVLAGAGAGAGAVKLVVVGVAAGIAAAAGAGVGSAVVVSGVDVVGTLTGRVVGTEVSVAETGAVAWAVGRVGVSKLAADAGVVAADAVVALDAVVVLVVVGIWPLVNGMDPRDAGRDVIASTDGRFCVLCSCEAWSMAWIMIVAMSELAGTVEPPPVLEVEVEGVVVAAVVAVLLVALESRVMCAGVLPVGRFCAAVIVAIAEAVVPTVVKLVTVTGVEVGGVVVAGVVVFAGALFCWFEFFPRGVKARGFCGVLGAGVVDVLVVVASVVAACAVAASSTLVVSEIVSRRGERASRMVAGATIVIERMVGVCVTGVLAAFAVVVVADVAAPMVAALLLGVVTSALCWSMASEKLCG